ncbi:predicted protein [Cyanophage PSS2]|uniref:hypothetical protein n=1 Tax=Cyanophage PSS2 TaxID=658401 RepID=UPI0001B03FE9|nr:hypothetical protein PSS2_gp020 [Cyanophage PSS2]ACT65582.1 hypothetical protein [Cyanophage PSS2]ACY75724.1 predicted protein [Cyanophage PSS2]
MAAKKKAPEFVYDAEKHIRVGEGVYNQSDLTAGARTEISLVHWIDQKLADLQAQLNTMRDGRTVCIQRLVVALSDVEPVHVEPPAEK